MGRRVPRPKKKPSFRDNIVSIANERIKEPGQHSREIYDGLAKQIPEHIRKKTANELFKREEEKIKAAFGREGLGKGHETIDDARNKSWGFYIQGRLTYNETLALNARLGEVFEDMPKKKK